MWFTITPRQSFGKMGSGVLYVMEAKDNINFGSIKKLTETPGTSFDVRGAVTKTTRNILGVKSTTYYVYGIETKAALLGESSSDVIEPEKRGVILSR